MKLFHRYEQCFGFSLPAIGRWKIEIWYCKSNYTIREHSHDNQDIKLIFLFGDSVMFHKREKQEKQLLSYLASFPKDFLKCFNIWAGESHSFEVSNLPLIFLNIEKYKPGITPTSASVDLQLTHKSKDNYAKTI